MGFIEIKYGDGNFINNNFENSLFEFLFIVFLFFGSKSSDVLEFRKIFELVVVVFVVKNIIIE